MRELGLRSEAAVDGVELLQGAVDQFVQQRQTRAGSIQVRGVTGEAFAVCDRLHHAAGGLLHLVMLVVERARHGHQHTAKAGPAVALLRREVGTAKVGPAIGCEEGGQRPSALPADGRNRGLVPGVHIGPLVSIHLHRDEVFVDQRGRLGVLVAFAIHDVAPVAPHRTDVQQHRLVLRRGACKGGLAPRLPPHRLMHGRTEVSG